MTETSKAPNDDGDSDMAAAGRFMQKYWYVGLATVSITMSASGLGLGGAAQQDVQALRDEAEDQALTKQELRNLTEWRKEVQLAMHTLLRHDEAMRSIQRQLDSMEKKVDKVLDERRNVRGANAPNGQPGRVARAVEGD